MKGILSHFTEVKGKSEASQNNGLPSPKDVRRQLRRVGVGLETRKKKNAMSYFREETFQIGDFNKAKFPSELYKQFEAEFEEDLRGFRIRIQRLKVRVLQMYVSGAGLELAHHLGGEEKSFYKKAGDLIPSRYAAKQLNGDQAKRIVSIVNKLVPSEYRLSYNDSLATEDIVQLDELLNSARFDRPLSKEEKARVSFLLTNIQNIERELFQVRDQRELFSSADHGFVSEAKLKDLWIKYREALKAFAFEEQLSSWHSPSYGSSGLGQRGRKQESEPFLSDYQRNYMPELERFERRFGWNYFGEEKRGVRIEHYLFNNGLNALTAILMAMDKEIKEMERWGKKNKAKIFKTRDIYFEVDSLVRDHFPRQMVQEFEPRDTDALIHEIKKELPLAVFLNPLSNMYKMEVTEVTKILEGLSNDDDWGRSLYKKLRLNPVKDREHDISLERNIYLIIDNTTLGRLAKWKEFDFSRLPRHVKVISFESLIKYAQDGQELTQAGLVSAIGEYAGSDIKSTRKYHGFMPPEDTVRKLSSAIPQDLIDKKMMRHSRNAEYLAERLRRVVERGDSFISEVIYPGGASDSQDKKATLEMSGGGGLLNIGFNWKKWKATLDAYMLPKNKFKNTAFGIAEGFNRLVIKLATQAGVELNMGTSYGLNTTRTAVYERVLDGEHDYEYRSIPYLRVALGTENIKEIYLITAIIERASEIFAKALREKKLVQLAEALSFHSSQEVVLGDS